ncbi:MAG: YggS family pyridoxal phosphate-dependent enzyme [Firmicutes bacterium HGW-Firmicutes-18]|nr:MAG: YggS family pyridoxal phosphate-dependent enzyme [Firmicutes bacterium HGW-Firmicutes-18]
MKDNVQFLLQEVKSVCDNSNIDNREVKIVAVTKTVGINEMKEAIESGLTEFGENRVQELMGKINEFDESVTWHMIGHLQRNKVKYIIDKISLIHSLDSIRLAEEIQSQSFKRQKKTDVLIEVNIGGEDSKFGVKPDEIMEFARTVCSFSNIRLRGLMTVAPFEEAPENVRPLMKMMYQKYTELKSLNLENSLIDTLSMGMSNDFKIALEEGATMIRVGSLIFGERT